MPLYSQQSNKLKLKKSMHEVQQTKEHGRHYQNYKIIFEEFVWRVPQGHIPSEKGLLRV